MSATPAIPRGVQCLEVTYKWQAYLAGFITLGKGIYPRKPDRYDRTDLGGGIEVGKLGLTAANPCAVCLAT